MSKFKVEKGVSMPDPRHGGSKYPWPDMQHGDSVALPLEGDYKSSQCRVQNAARAWLARHRPGWKAVTRREGDAIRVWFLDPSRNGAA